MGEKSATKTDNKNETRQPGRDSLAAGAPTAPPHSGRKSGARARSKRRASGVGQDFEQAGNIRAPGPARRCSAVDRVSPRKGRQASRSVAPGGAHPRHGPLPARVPIQEERQPLPVPPASSRRQTVTGPPSRSQIAWRRTSISLEGIVATEKILANSSGVPKGGKDYPYPLS